MTQTRSRDAFGALLKDWRRRRRASQLDLALGADVSARHVSFIETGRSQPSRAMVLRLAAELDVPHAARNEWLTAAGYAEAYPARPLDAEETKAARQAVAWMLERHDPFPAFALDRHWRIVSRNAACARLLGLFDVGEGDSIIDAFLDNRMLQEAVVNRAEIAAHTRSRLRAESARYGGDPVLDEAIGRLTRMLGDEAETLDGDAAFVPIRYRLGDLELSLFSSFSHFTSARDVALAELRVEMMFPADDATRARLLAAAGSTGRA